MTFVYDSNLKDIAEPCLPVVPMQESKLAGPMLLQISKEVTDISRPLKFQSDEGGHRMLRVVLSDGTRRITGIERTKCTALRHDIRL